MASFTDKLREALKSNHAIEFRYEVVDEVVTFEKTADWPELLDNIHVIFNNCVFKKSLTIRDFVLISKIDFKQCVFFEQVLFQEISFSLSFHGCTFYKKVTLAYSPTQYDQEIYEVIVLDRLDISGSPNRLRICEVNSESSNTGKVLGNLNIHSLTCSNLDFKSIRCEQMDLFEYVEVKFVIFTDVHVLKANIDVIVESHFRVIDCKIDRISTEYSQIKGQLYIFNSNIKTVTLFLENLGQVIIQESAIHNMEIYGNWAADKIFSISNCNIEHLEFFELVNRGNIILRNLGECQNLIILNSNLGKADFILCDFSNAIFRFSNSKLTEIFLAEVDFPRFIVNAGKRHYKQSQLAFGQINSAYQKQGDTIRALEYHAREVESHFRDLLRNKKFFNVTTWNLTLNFISNNFERNWGVGVLFSIVVGAIFFIFVVISTPEYVINISSSVEEKLLISFLKFINPLRFFDAEKVFHERDEPYVTFGFWSYFFDFLGRIAVAYGVYQTIQAFRRYGRK